MFYPAIIFSFFIFSFTAQAVELNKETRQQKLNPKNKILEDKANKNNLQASIEGGITLENGNSDTEFYYGSLKANYTINDKWSDIFNFRGENRIENHQRLKEEYRFNDQLRYSVSQLNYSFIELEYVSDRYGGYDYRISETFGLGRNFIKKDDFILSAQISTGLRQSKFSNSDKDDSFVGRVGSNIDWKIKSNLSFSENFDISLDNEGTIIKSDTNLRVAISESLYLKFNYFIENKSDVPQGIKNTDNRLMFIIGYSIQ